MTLRRSEARAQREAWRAARTRTRNAFEMKQASPATQPCEMQGTIPIKAKMARHLDLRYARLSTHEMIELKVALQTDSTLLNLGLGEASIGDAGATLLADALQHNTTLTALDLEFNRIEPPGAKRLAEALAVCYKLNGGSLPDSIEEWSSVQVQMWVAMNTAFSDDQIQQFENHKIGGALFAVLSADQLRSFGLHKDNAIFVSEKIKKRP